MSGWTEKDLSDHMSKFKVASPQALANEEFYPSAAPKPSKYRSVKTTVDGIVFDSAKEARRWQALKLLERARCIRDIERQVRFPLHVNGVLITTYVCDFRYVDLQADGAAIVEDCKGFMTREYKIKRALMQALHGVEILET